MGGIIQADSLTRIWLKSPLEPRGLSVHTHLEQELPVRWDYVALVISRLWLWEDGRLWPSKLIANFQEVKD